MMELRKFFLALLIAFFAIPGQMLAAESEVGRILGQVEKFVEIGNKEEGREKPANLSLIQMLILDLQRIGTPEAASALMSIVLDPAVAEYDKVRWKDPQRIGVETVLGNTCQGVAPFAGRQLAKFPLSETPLILSVPWVKDGPNLSRALENYAGFYPAQFVADCQAWCEEVRDGKRPLKFVGHSREYDFHGKSLTTRSTSRGAESRKSDESKRVPEEDQEAGDKVPMWILLLSGAAVLGACGYWWMGRKSVIRR